MSEAREINQVSAPGPNSRRKFAERTTMLVFKPRYSLLDLVLAMALLGGIATVSMVLWARNYGRQWEEAVFESPLRDVRLADIAQQVPDSISYKKHYVFNVDWFTHNIPIWEKALSAYRGKAGIHYLEVGTFEGRSALWALENILTHPTARLTCIDLFNGPYKKKFFANLERSGESGKVTALSDYSQLALRKLQLNNYDIIYIDGSHSKDDVLEDAVLSWRLLKEGGIMIFDDYRWIGLFASGTSDAPTDFCKPAIDRFVQCFDRHFEVLHNSNQLIIRKIRKNKR